jgi:phage portal protein BeeE
VHRAVRLVAESIGALSFGLYEGTAELTAHPQLNLLVRPNPREDGVLLMETLSSHLLLSGNAYIEAVGIDGATNPNVRELYALQPDRMKVVPGPHDWPQAYEYTFAGAASLAASARA